MEISNKRLEGGDWRAERIEGRKEMLERRLEIGGEAERGRGGEDERRRGGDE